MRFTKIDKIEPNMMSARNVFDKNGTLLLAANRPITPEIIGAMKRADMSGLYIFDEYTKYEQLRSVVNEDLRRDAINGLREINIDKVIFLTNQIVDSILSSRNLLVDLHELSDYDSDTYEHSMSVCTLATTCGVGLGLKNIELKDLALAAILHDIGKTAIPIEILNKKGKLTPEERNIIEEHPRLGYDMLYPKNEISSYVRAAVLAHHENYDGSGYPKNLKGDEIPYYGRIIHVADVYDALVKKRSYKEDYTQSESLEYLMGGCGSLFDYDIVSTFMQYIVVYPVGCDVELSDGQIVHVIKNRASAVMRPVVMTENKKVLDLARDEKYFNLTVIREVVP